LQNCLLGSLLSHLEVRQTQRDRNYRVGWAAVRLLETLIDQSKKLCLMKKCYAADIPSNEGI
jgi:hypothetical protein